MNTKYSNVFLFNILFYYETRMGRQILQTRSEFPGKYTLLKRMCW